MEVHWRVLEGYRLPTLLLDGRVAYELRSIVLVSRKEFDPICKDSSRAHNIVPTWLFP